MDTGEPILNKPLNETPSTPPENQHSAWKSVLEWAWVIAVALVFAYIIRSFVAEPFVVNGASMDPTFSTNQFLIVDRVTYRFDKPGTGDVIIFKYPNDPSTYYIKRVIGLPGETVSIKDGRVFLSTGSSTPVELTEPYIAPIHASHDNLSITLDSDHYFVMGDNRAQSSDSRAWGPLATHFIVGRPIVRLFPLTALSVLPGQYKE